MGRGGGGEIEASASSTNGSSAALSPKTTKMTQCSGYEMIPPTPIFGRGGEGEGDLRRCPSFGLS